MSEDTNHQFDLRLARYLSADSCRSGETIAGQLGCSRTAVWKHVQSLRQLGLGIDAVAGQGYRLQHPLELLDETRIRAELGPQSLSLLQHMEILVSVDSTNTRLLNGLPHQQAGNTVLAERQTAGRGRRGNRWVSPFACNVYLSLCWKFDSGVADLGCMPLVVALATAAALERVGLQDHRIKWPNDILLDGRKLAGCLVELQGDACGPCFAVIGVGINVRMQPQMEHLGMIDQPWTDLASELPQVSRNQCAGVLLDELISHLVLYEQNGFRPFQAQWLGRDELAGREVEILHHNQRIRGVVRGISERGAILLEKGGTVAEYVAGEVSVLNRDG